MSQAQHDHAGPSGSNRCFAPSELHDFIEYAVAEYEVDPDRVYVSGESCGAYAVFDYLGVHGATQVAAAVPIAGDGRPAYNDVGCRLWAAPVWAFHSRKDPEVPLAGSEEPISASGECGGAAPRLTVVDGVRAPARPRDCGPATLGTTCSAGSSDNVGPDGDLHRIFTSRPRFPAVPGTPTLGD